MGSQKKEKRGPKKKFFKEIMARDLTGGPVVKNPPSNAGDTGFRPGKELGFHMLQGNQACAPQPENWRAATIELMRSGAHASQLEGSPCITMKGPACCY